MRWLALILSIVLIALVRAQEELALAEPCDEELCLLPSCRCSSVEIPGGLDRRDTPQFVVLTWDDAVNSINILTYREILYGRRNSNNCPIGATFYVNHGYTDYSVVNELHNTGFEIGLKSITHRTPQDFWRDATYDVLMQELGEQRRQMSHFANIPVSEIYGMRSPYLQLAGNETFRMMVSSNLLYDASWTTISFTNPGLWPYTLDYQSVQDCMTPPCPTASIPGPWVLPMIAWFDLEGIPCSTLSSCFNVPDSEDEEAWYRFIVTNFERQYLGNRAPFGIYASEGHISGLPAIRRALVRFMDLLSNINDVYMVNSKDVIDWVRNPIPIDEYRNQGCGAISRTACARRFCGPLTANHTLSTFYMNVCSTTCPNVYPWIDNPLGV